METNQESEAERETLPALKPSLVEWKHFLFKLHSNIFIALKPSLVEWKQVPASNLAARSANP